MLDWKLFPLLNQINQPSDLRQLESDQLPTLADELRLFLYESLNISGGHFGAGLGTVELTIALHYLYNTPHDKLVWDVGHQAYPHKILTGRAKQLQTIRQTNGLAPFPKRSESVFDCFGVGHSSTSISAALGFAIGHQLSNEPHKSIAIIGDGAMTAGMAFEALNHAGDLHADMLVILNDNDMSISNNVGALSNYFSRILASKLYCSVREGSKKVLQKMPPMWEFMKRTELHMKGMIVPGTLFEELGFYYIGPIDGHDLDALLKVLSNLRKQTGPKLLHVVTQKGKGYPPAEADPIKYHAVKPNFYHPVKTTQSSSPKQPSYSHVFGEWICDMAKEDPNLVAITPAMCEGSDLVTFAKQFPERYFDVGIAEQHSITFAAGLACTGKKPVVAIYSTFLQRAYDQLIHDVCIQDLSVLFAIDRAGLVGGDGTTHNGNFDLSYLRCIPNLIIMAPSNENECRQMLYTGFQYPGAVAVRYPRGVGPGVPTEKTMQCLPLGKAEIKHHGKHIALLAFGSMVQPALEAGEQLDATVVNMRFVKPLDHACIIEIAKNHELIVTIEENTIAGGAGSGVNEVLASLPCKLLNLGLPDQFLHHGDSETLLERAGLNAQGIIDSIQRSIPLALENAISKEDLHCEERSFDTI